MQTQSRFYEPVLILSLSRQSLESVQMFVCCIPDLRQSGYRLMYKMFTEIHNGIL